MIRRQMQSALSGRSSPHIGTSSIHPDANDHDAEVQRQLTLWRADFEAALQSASRNHPRPLVRRIRSGIPNSLRGWAWCRILRTHQVPRHLKNYQREVQRIFAGGNSSNSITDEDWKKLLEGSLNCEIPSFGSSLDVTRMSQSANRLEVTKRILCILADTHPQLEYTPIIPAIVAILAKHLSGNPDELLACMTAMIDGHMLSASRRHEWAYFPLHRRDYLVFERVFEDLIADVCPKIAQHIAEIQKTEPEYAPHWERILSGLFIGILPRELVMRIMDCYLTEGFKIIFRFAIAHLTVRQSLILATDSGLTMDAVILQPANTALSSASNQTQRRSVESVGSNDVGRLAQMTAHGHSLSLAADSGTFTDNEGFVVVRGMADLSVSDAANERNPTAALPTFIEREDIVPLHERNLSPTPIGAVALEAPKVVAKGRGKISEATANLIESYFQAAMSVRFDRALIDRYRTRWRKFSMGELNASNRRVLFQRPVPTLHRQSSFMSMHDWTVLWAWIPARFRLLGLDLLYSTSEHGRHLINLFARCATIEPVVILIQTASHRRLGAYLSRAITVDHGPCFYGTGETFIFSLQPLPKRYAWTQLNSSFQCVTESFVALGAGDDFGLWFDRFITQVASAACRTFANDPLIDGSVPEDHIIDVLEVFSFC